MSSHTTTSTPTVAVVQEPLTHYYPFIHNDTLLKRAQTPQMVEPYLRWQYVGHGGVNAYTQLDLAPTGWEGYVVGLPPEEQFRTLRALGQEMLQRLSHVGHQAGIPTDRLLAGIAEERYTQRTARLLEPIFFAALMRMRTVGQDGFHLQDYSRWRTEYEQELANLEEALCTANDPGEVHSLTSQIFAKQWSLKTKLAEFTRGRRTAVFVYETVRQTVAELVNKIVQAVDQPMAVDVQAAHVRYLLPVAPSLPTTATTTVAPKGPEWYIPLHNLPLLGHPLIRVALAAKG